MKQILFYILVIVVLRREQFHKKFKLQVFAIDDKNVSNVVNRVAKERSFSESRVVKILRIWHPSHLSYSSVPRKHLKRIHEYNSPQLQLQTDSKLDLSRLFRFQSL